MRNQLTLKGLHIFIYAILLFSCTPNPNRLQTEKKTDITPPSEGYSIVFYEIDNYAQIYIDDEMVVNTRNLSEETQNEVIVELKDFINPDSKKLKIEIYNLPCVTCKSNTWKATYVLYDDGKELEYVSESSGGQQASVGLSYTKIHDLIL